VKAFGVQLIAEFLDCQQFQLLQHQDTVKALLREGLPAAGLDLRELVAHQFEPVGVTAVAIIGESHVALHTYPETHHLAVDIFTCSPGSPGPERLLAWLKDRLQPQQLRRAEIIRGQKITLQEQHLLTDLSKSGHDVRYHVQATLLHQRTAWQEIRVIENPSFGRMLFLDQELQIAESDRVYHQALVEPLRGQAGIRQLAVLGGGDGGVLQECFRHLPELERVYLLELDPAVIEASQRFLSKLCGQAFADPRLELRLGEVLAQLPALPVLDAVVSDLGLSPWRHSGHAQEIYLVQLLQAIRSHLRPGGFLSLQVGPVSEAPLRHALEKKLSDLFQEVAFEEGFIPSFCEPWVFAQGRVL